MGIEPMVSPASSTDFDPIAPMAMASSTTLQRTVILRARPTSPLWRKSTTVVEASEFRAALMLAMAAARIAAMMRPATPGGRWFQMNST